MRALGHSLIGACMLADTNPSTLRPMYDKGCVRGYFPCNGLKFIERIYLVFAKPSPSLSVSIADYHVRWEATDILKSGQRSASRTISAENYPNGWSFNLAGARGISQLGAVCAVQQPAGNYAPLISIPASIRQLGHVIFRIKDSRASLSSSYGYRTADMNTQPMDTQPLSDPGCYASLGENAEWQGKFRIASCTDGNAYTMLLPMSSGAGKARGALYVHKNRNDDANRFYTTITEYAVS